MNATIKHIAIIAAIVIAMSSINDLMLASAISDVREEIELLRKDFSYD